jgi:hypothetical protein
MKRISLLGALALAATLAGCDSSQATAPSSGPGALAIALPARVLQTVSVDSDSLRVALYGPSDTIWSVAHLTDTLRFDGLRAGWWTVQADLFSNDSGPRDRHWTGSAGTYVEPGRTARVGLALRRATGSLIVEISLEDDRWVDTAAWPDTGAWLPPVDTGAWYSGDSTRWIDSVRRADSIYRNDTGWRAPTDTPMVLPVGTDTLPETLWDTAGTPFVSPLHPDTLNQGTSRVWYGAVSQGVILLSVEISGTNTVPFASAAPAQACGTPDVDSGCDAWRVRILSRTTDGGRVQNAQTSRFVHLMLDLSASPLAQGRGVSLPMASGINQYFANDLLTPMVRFQTSPNSPTGGWWYDVAGFRRPMTPS